MGIILYEVFKEVLIIGVVVAILYGSYWLGFHCAKEGGFRNYFGLGNKADDHKVIRFDDLDFKTKKDTLSRK